MKLSAKESQFWEIAAPLQASPAVTRSTMMGLPCLRVNGQFFASFDRRAEQLVVKLASDRVDKLIASGKATAFAPAGRRFRQWAAISWERRADWPDLLDEAVEFVRTLES
jgi:hypothetical protein